MDLAAMEVRDRLDRARTLLPSDVERLYIRRWQISDRPIFVFGLAWSGEPEEFYDIVQNVIQIRLQRIEGVANVEIRGMDIKEIQVDLFQDRLKAYGIDLNRLSNSIKTNNKNEPGGWVKSGEKKYTIRAIGEYQSIEEISETPVRGKDILLKDVAEVSYDFPERKSFSRLDGKKAVYVMVYKASSANIVDISKNINRTLEEIKAEPKYKYLKTQVRWDQSVAISESLDNLTRSGLIGGGLAIIMLFIFLRKFSSTIVISLAVPASLIFTFFFIYLIRMRPIEADTSLNLITMMAMVYAIGIVVDPSIVILENIFRHKERTGADSVTAAIKGSSEVGTAIFAAVITNMIVFLPLIMIGQGSAGGGKKMGGAMKFISEFGIVFCVVSLASLIVALTIIPLMSSRMFKKLKPTKKVPLGLFNSLYLKIIKRTLKYRFLTIIAVTAMLYGAFLLYDQIDRQMTPRTPSRRANFTVVFSRNFSSDEIKKIFKKIETVLLENKEDAEIKSVASSYRVGRGRGGRLDVYLKDAAESDRSTIDPDRGDKKSPAPDTGSRV